SIIKAPVNDTLLHSPGTSCGPCAAWNRRERPPHKCDDTLRTWTASTSFSLSLLWLRCCVWAMPFHLKKRSPAQEKRVTPLLNNRSVCTDLVPDITAMLRFTNGHDLLRMML
ncbi:hypothetical protein MTO96_047021, partial [Rhipicephalus appendiculatus]